MCIRDSLNTNLGVFARAAVANSQNTRGVPGILARPGDPGAEIPPYHSDWDHPTVFWIMNGWNQFQYNFASSAGTCGACYWLVPGGISGPSQYEYFEGYAGQQTVTPQGARAGYSPLQKLSLIHISGRRPGPLDLASLTLLSRQGGAPWFHLGVRQHGGRGGSPRRSPTP